MLLRQLHHRKIRLLTARKIDMTKKCQYKGCGEEIKIINLNRDRYCNSHAKKATIGRFLSRLYTGMKRRTQGKSTKSPHLYIGKPIMPRDVFTSWAKNHPDFLALYKRWASYDFDRKLTPTINRINASRGYTLGNIEWMTHSQNSGLSGAVKKMKARKEIYNLLGVNTNVQ